MFQQVRACGGTYYPEGWRPGLKRPERCSSGDPSAIRASGSRASRRHKGLRKRLHHVRDLARGLPDLGRDYAYAAPRVGPDLKVWAVPQHDQAKLGRLGLSLPANSQNQKRSGISGISSKGKKQIQWSCRLMEEFRSKTAIWTVTLTDNDYLELAASRKWPEFQRRVVDLLVRYLKAHGDEAVVIACVEIGGKRFARTGRPDPHIHVVTTGWGRRHPEGGWLLSPDRMDELVAKACQYAGLPLVERRSASSIAKVRHSVASYMSKYLTKQAPVDIDKVDGEWLELIPRQWWNQSEACKALVDGCLFKLPRSFAAFIVRNAVLLEKLGMGRGGNVVVGHKKTKFALLPIEMFRFRFKTPELLQQAMELFAVWIECGETLDVRELVLSG
jgi:hypothetical protein